MIVLIISGCGKDAPVLKVTHIYETDLDYGVCGQYKINQKTRKKQHVQDLPLIACNGVFGVQPEDVPVVEDWIDDTIKYLKDKCL